jgi:hypothetical protein
VARERGVRRPPLWRKMRKYGIRVGGQDGVAEFHA